MGLSLLPLGFSFILVFSRLLQLYRTDNKTSDKILYSEAHPERLTELHEEEERKEGDTDEQEEKRGDSRGERQIYTVVYSQSVLRSPDTHKDSQNWIGKGRGREEIEVF